MKINTENLLDINHIKLENECGMRIELSAYGASIYNIELLVDNEFKSVVLTPTNLSDFRTNTSYHGKTIGRYSGRIDKGICQLNDKEFKLDINWNNVSSLHGGFNGLSSQVFDSNIEVNDDFTDVVFTLDNEVGILPGVAKYEIRYRLLNDKKELSVFFKAVSTEDTLMNLTNHTYFNLSGDCKSTILNHNLYLPCDKYTKLNNELITEQILPVNDIMDFTNNHEIGKYIEDSSLQNHKSRGYDHCFIKSNPDDDLTAILSDSQSRITMEMYSSYPAVVFYSGCYTDSFPFNKDKVANIKYHALCLEPQFIPNGINMDGVDKAILKANEEYSHYIRYEFKIK